MKKMSKQSCRREANKLIRIMEKTEDVKISEKMKEEMRRDLKKIFCK